VTRFRVSGLVVESECANPYWQIDSPARLGLPDVEVALDPDPALGVDSWTTDRRLSSGGFSDLRWEPRKGLRFRIRDGASIAVYRPASYSEEDVAAPLSGLVWGLLCHQRKLLPLHCSSVRHGGRAFAFTGASGSGKSTLVAGFLERGYALCSDDVMVVDTATGCPETFMAATGLKLCEDAAQRLLQPAETVRVTTRFGKYRIPLGAPTGPERLEVAALYALKFHEAGPAVIRKISGGEHWQTLYQSVHGVGLMPRINTPRVVFPNLATLAEKIEVFSFSRPRDFRRFGDGLDMLERHIQASSEAFARRRVSAAVAAP